MGRRPVANKKIPGDYPQFAFRVSKIDKARLNTLISEAQSALNRQSKGEAPFINKNDVIVRALYAGLKTIKKFKAAIGP